MIIAIDGPSGAGKGTIAKHLGNVFDLLVIDSGLFYRYVALQAHFHNLEEMITIARNIHLKDLNNPELKQETVAEQASKIAVYPEVRLEITNRLQILAKGKNVVVDGRDIGTHVFPDTDIKIFVTATPKARHERRAKEMNSQDSSIESTIMMERDHRDEKREASPLLAAHDAYVLDTSDLSIEEACKKAEMYVRSFQKK